MTISAPKSKVQFTVLSSTEITAWMLGEDPAPRYSLNFEARRTVPLITGRRGSRKRVEHARLLRMATWKRRRQRRHGVPAATVYVRTYIPNARVTG